MTVLGKTLPTIADSFEMSDIGTFLTKNVTVPFLQGRPIELCQIDVDEKSNTTMLQRLEAASAAFEAGKIPGDVKL